MAKAKGKADRPSPRPSPAGGSGRKKLKVFRTPIGFHDAYVAAPSQKAALEAWGTDTDLFARGVAEGVTDPTLTKEPLERQGEVVRVLRGSAEEQVRALGQSHRSGTSMGTRQSATKTAKEDRPSPRPSPSRGRGRKKRGRRPSSAAVDRAEAALERAEARHRAALDKLKAEAEALDKRRRALERKQRAEREKLNHALDTARERFRKAMEEWAG